jgi:TerC family integral membrane protein
MPQDCYVRRTTCLPVHSKPTCSAAATMISLYMLIGSTAVTSAFAFSNESAYHVAIRTAAKGLKSPATKLSSKLTPWSRLTTPSPCCRLSMKRSIRSMHGTSVQNSLCRLQMTEKNSLDGSIPTSSSSSGLGPLPPIDLFTGQLPLPDTSLRLSLEGESQISSNPISSTQQSEVESAYLFVEEEINLEDAYEKAILQTLAWVGAAALFGLGLIQTAGLKTGEEFFAGYLVEQSLSVDNLFVFLLLFDYFKVPVSYQGRVLKWGIFGAIIMRGIMIGLGAAALKSFHPILLVFASFLVYSSVQTLGGLLKGEQEEEGDVGEDAIVKFTRRWLSSVDYFDGDRFFTLVDGVKKATPLLLCMVAVEISDVVFAVDSIPAVFGVTEVSLFNCLIFFP